MPQDILKWESQHTWTVQRDWILKNALDLKKYPAEETFQ